MDHSKLSLYIDKDIIIPRALFATNRETFATDIVKLEQYYSKILILNTSKLQKNVLATKFVKWWQKDIMYTLLHGSNKYECSKSYPKIDDLRITKFIMHLAICIGGGTNLALRYNHRISIDIDFITPILIGRIGFYQIIKVVKALMERSK